MRGRKVFMGIMITTHLTGERRCILFYVTCSLGWEGGGVMIWRCAYCDDLAIKYEKVRINKGVEQYFCLSPTDGKKSCADEHRDKLGARIWLYEIIAVVS